MMLSNEDMVKNIEKVCGRSSISYYNILNYSNADNVVVETMYSQMLERERVNVQNKLDDLREKLKEIEDLQQKLKN